MSDYTAHNLSVIKVGLREFAEKEAKKEVVRRMRIIAGKMIDLIERVFSDESEQFPEWTANLHDATGIGIYVDGHLDKYMPVQRASTAQQSRSGEDVWGTTELSEALTKASTTFAKGLWLVMFSAVDYAEQIEKIGSPKDRGRSFFTSLCEYLGMDVKEQFGTAIVGMSGPITSFAR
ncbi:MAG: hypothetical protein K2N25_04515 [Muribaculaceae bacterium]|nr:hypothetical protein [Muribaculaceae bacterium]